MVKRTADDVPPAPPRFDARMAPVPMPGELLAALDAWVAAERAARPERQLTRADLVRGILADAVRAHAGGAAGRERDDVRAPRPAPPPDAVAPDDDEEPGT